MKKLISLFLSAATLLSLCACGGARDPLAGTSWINVNDGDCYTFNADGTGTHGDKEITYTLEGTALSITEGVATPTPKSFTLDDASTPTKLTPDPTFSYYVPAEEYETIGAQVREENIATLMSCEFWSSTSALSYMQFLENGTGWVLVTGSTFSHEWEMLDNNTVQSTLYNNGTTMTTTLDIIGGDQPMLIDPSTHVVLWKPKM